MAKILLIEDDAMSSEIIRNWLQQELHVVEQVELGADAMELLRTYSYDLLIVDWGLPDLTGIDVIKEYRSRGGQSPILMLTGKKEIAEKELGFDSGADDYLTKPFSLRELAVRIRALLRRPPIVTESILQAGSISLDTKLGKVTRVGEEIKLLPSEYALLEFFMRHPNQLFSSDAILNHVWKFDTEASHTSVRIYVSRLRKKIDLPGQPSLISTVFKLGYRLEAP